MKLKKILIVAVALAALSFAVPFFLPSGPRSSIDAEGLLTSGRLFLAIGAIFLGGLLTSLTPCVYPLIPITVSVFGARRTESRARALGLTSLYVVGMGVVFSALGVVAALSGKAFGSALGDWKVALGLAVFFLVLAASMFGAFELALPSSWATQLNRVGGSGVAGAFLMGAVSGFLAAPCTGPVLSGVLTFVATSQNPVLGAGLLFVYALGVGVPFFLIGAFAMKLPKSGEWMEWVKSFFGVALVAMAASYVRDAVPALRTFVAQVASQLGQYPGALLAAALVAAGVLVGALHRSFKEGASEFALKSVGVVLLVLAVLLRVGASDAAPQGKLWVRLGLQAPAERVELAWGLKFPTAPDNYALAPFDEALARAKAEGRPVMIDFFAEWCAACKELDRETYVDPQVVTESQRFLNIKIDATNDDEALSALFARFGVKGLPTVSFIDARGAVLQDPKVTGFLPPQDFLAEQRKVR